MKITNKFNLPDAVYNAISIDNYVRGDNNYSVTELIEAPQIVQLKRRHWGELEEDAIDRVWSIFGNAVHHIMETHASDESFVEQRYYITRQGRKIGGMVDCYNDGVISDYKVTSAWSIVYGSRVEHWTEQLNLYAHILRENDLPVTKVQIVTFLRDWDRNKAKADFTYPQAPLIVIPITLWSEEECEAFIEKRLQWHILNEDLPNEALTHCTQSDTWEQPSKYAVMKEGGTRATRVFEAPEEAVNYVADLPAKDRAKFEVVHRPGKRTRCEDYCSLAPFCEQYKQYKITQGV